MAFAALIVLPYWLLTDNLSSIVLEPAPLLLLLASGIIFTALPYTLYFTAIQLVPAQTAAILSYIDPAVAVLISALVLHESMTLLTLLGILFVLGAAIVSELPSKNQNPSRKT